MTALTTSAVGVSKMLEVAPEILEYLNKYRVEARRYRKQRWGQEVLENLELSFTMDAIFNDLRALTYPSFMRDSRVTVTSDSGTRS